MKPDDTLHCHSNSTIWLEVRGDDAPFDVTGHYPILAGFTSDESPRELYVAMVYPQPFTVCYVYVEDGAQFIEYVDGRGKRRIASTFYVMVLRHDLADVQVPHASGVPKYSDIILQTGPVHWTRGTTGNVDDSCLGSKLHLWESDALKPVLYAPSRREDSLELDDGVEDGIYHNVDQTYSGFTAPLKSFGQQVKEIKTILAGGCVLEDWMNIRAARDSEGGNSESEAQNNTRANLRWQIKLPLLRYLDV